MNAAPISLPDADAPGGAKPDRARAYRVWEAANARCESELPALLVAHTVATERQAKERERHRGAMLVHDVAASAADQQITALQDAVSSAAQQLRATGDPEVNRLTEALAAALADGQGAAFAAGEKGRWAAMQTLFAALCAAELEANQAAAVHQALLAAGPTVSAWAVDLARLSPMASDALEGAHGTEPDQL